MKIQCLQYSTRGVEVMRLQSIRVEKIPLSFVNKYAVHDFWQLPVNVLHTDFTCSKTVLHVSLRGIITTFCIHAIVN